MKNFEVKKMLKKSFPGLAKIMRKHNLTKIAKSQPQYSNELDIKFWGVQQIDSYEPSITKVLDSIVSNAQVFINVGANHGIYVLRYAKKGKEVIAFEALQENVSLLLKNIKENNLGENVIVFPVAASSKNYIERFFGMSSGGSLIKGWNQQYDDGQLVQCMTLNYLLADKIAGKASVFLIDVEGAEFQVIQGAEEIMGEHNNAKFIVEIPTREFMPGEKFNPNFCKIFELFFSYGYVAYEIESNGELKKIDSHMVSEMQRLQRYDGLMAYFYKLTE